MTEHTHELRASLSSDGLLLADGSLWSHACTVGQYNKGEAFSLGQDAIRNFVRVFTSGYPNKVPVDYEHASTSNDPEVRKLRASGDVPKAGDVKELAAVFSAADFDRDPALKQTAERLAQKAGRSLDDPKNLGLWMRWKPTPKALGKIQADEFSELSITFDDNYPDKTTGKGQGPTILAVALTMMPFLDEMLPVAASRGRREGEAQHDPAAGGSPATESREEHAMSTKMLAATTALTGKPVASEDEAVVELTALGKEVPALRSLSADLAKELNVEGDPTKILAGVRELAAQNATFKAEAEKQRKARIAAEVEGLMKKSESKLTKLSRDYFAKQLTRELEAGAKLDDAETAKTIASLPDLGITDRSSGADVDDGKSKDPERRMLSRVNELLKTDEELKALNKSDPHTAYMRACEMAEAEVLSATT